MPTNASTKWPTSVPSVATSCGATRPRILVATTEEVAEGPSSLAVEALEAEAVASVEAASAAV